MFTPLFYGIFFYAELGFRLFPTYEIPESFIHLILAKIFFKFSKTHQTCANHSRGKIKTIKHFQFVPSMIVINDFTF